MLDVYCQDGAFSKRHCGYQHATSRSSQELSYHGIRGWDGKLSEVEKRLFALAAAKMHIEKDELEKLIDRLVGKSANN